MDESGPARACGEVRPDVWGGLRIVPRRWQAECLPIVVQAMEEGRRGVVSAIMGAGKTKMCAAIVATQLEAAEGRAVVVAVPSQNLVQQTVEVFRAVLSCSVGAFYADRKESAADVVVVCYPSMGALVGALDAARRGTWLCIVDEVHKSEADRMKASLPQLGAQRVVGFTATPYRSLPTESLSLWDEVVYRYTLEDALRDGVLVPFRHVRWDGVGDSAADAVVLHMARRMRGPGIVSALHIADAEGYAQYLREAGVPAEAIHSKQPDARRVELLDMLRSGSLSCLVHVALLAEGVDMPWLRWIALRRPVQARVRFLQELGRVLRADAGKVEAHVLDPHDLLTVHGLQTAEAIGEAMRLAAEAQEEGEANEDEEKKKRERRMPAAVALHLLLSHLADLTVAAREAGILPAVPAVSPGRWRDQAPSEKQADACKRLAWMASKLPGEHCEPVARLMAHPYALTRGQLSDLLTLVTGTHDWRVEKATKHGIKPWFVKLPRLDVERHADLDLAIAAMEGAP